jgi:hypothetical protein
MKRKTVWVVGGFALLVGVVLWAGAGFFRLQFAEIVVEHRCYWVFEMVGRYQWFWELLEVLSTFALCLAFLLFRLRKANGLPVSRRGFPWLESIALFGFLELMWDLVVRSPH